MSEAMFYMTIAIKEEILTTEYFYIDNLYNAIQEITKDFLKSDEYKKEESLFDSVLDYIRNNKRLIMYIMVKENVNDEEILRSI